MQTMLVHLYNIHKKKEKNEDNKTKQNNRREKKKIRRGIEYSEWQSSKCETMNNLTNTNTPLIHCFALAFTLALTLNRYICVCIVYCVLWRAIERA